MTQEEMQHYISENEPSEIIRDEIGRWVQRIWELDDINIVESYSYKYSVAEVQSDPHKHRDSFSVLSTELKEVQNG